MAFALSLFTPFVALIFAVFIIFLVAVEWWVSGLKLQGGIKGEVVRKLIHIGSALLLLAAPQLLSPMEIVFLLVLVALVLGLGRALGIIHSMHTVQRRSWGELFFPLGIAINALLFLPAFPHAYAVGILTLAIADSLAALVGSTWGRHKIPVMDRRRSFEGSAAFIAATAFILLWFGAPMGVPLLIGLFLLAIMEALLPWGIDNLTIPVASGTLYLIAVVL